jgi:O-antigen biosynthesis protein
MRTLGLFTPYALVPGGGERYLLSIAEAFRDEFEVFLVTPEEQSKDRLARLAQQLDVQVDHVVPIRLQQALARAPFDVAIVMGNEPLPALRKLGNRNVFLCQFPFPTDRDELTRRLVFWPHYERVVVYSEYAKAHTQQGQNKILAAGRPIHIIHPPVSAVSATSTVITKRPGMILSVGRFASTGHNKCQDKLIAAFRQISATGLSLHLAGTLYSSQDSQDTYELCRKLAQDSPVTFHPNATRAELGQLYAQADCYWHGTGLGADRETQPEKFEHFGITVVEAMASGSIPFVLDHGGPASVVTAGCNGWTYRTQAELVELTSGFLMSTNLDLVNRMRAAARRRACEYRFEVFRRRWKELMAISEGQD